MVYRPAIDGQACFVLLPLRAPFLGYFEKIIKPAALEAGLTAIKADDIYGTRAVIKDIWDQIWKARAVIAIVTDKNPNVNYELGICHSLGIPTVLITEREDDVPFDYRHRRYIRYRPREADWQQKLIEDLTKTLKTILASPNLNVDEELPWPYDTFEMNAADRIGHLLTADKARSAVIKGADLVGRALLPAFGPEGTRVSVTSTRLGRQVSYRQGDRIGEGINSGSPLESQGIEQMRRLAREMRAAVGDLSKITVFLSVEMLKAGDTALKAGHKPKHLLMGMRRATEAATGYLMTQAKPVAAEQLRSVALTACAGDEAVTKAVTDAFAKAGDTGVVQVVDGDGINLGIDFQEGMSFDRGFISPFFVTDPERQECVLENSFVLIYDGEIKSMHSLLTLLERVAKARKPILIIANDVAEEALSTLVINKQRGTLACAAVKTPGAGDNRDALLEDIAILTGGKAFLQEVMKPLTEIELRELGRSEKIVISKNTTTLIGGAGQPEQISARIKQLRREISRTSSDFEADRLRERLAKLGGGIVVLRAAGRTLDDLADSRYRIESAMHSCASSIENGYVVGGGVPYLRARAVIEKLVPKNETEKLGIDIVSATLLAPLRKLLESSKHQNPDEVIRQIAQGTDASVGFNVESGQVEDLAASGVLDSAKALYEALHLSFAYAEGILKTAAWDSPKGSKVQDSGEPDF